MAAVAQTGHVDPPGWWGDLEEGKVEILVSHPDLGVPRDVDTDNDGVSNWVDAFPEDPTRSLDEDGDGLADEDEGYVASRIANSHTGFILVVVFIAFALGAIGGWYVVRTSTRLVQGEGENFEQGLSIFADEEEKSD